MRCGISVVIRNVEIVVRLNKHLEHIKAVFEPGAQMQRIVPMDICVVDFAAVFSEDAHHVAMAVLGCDPEGVEPLLVLLVNINHLIFEHELHKVLTKSIIMSEKLFF